MRFKNERIFKMKKILKLSAIYFFTLALTSGIQSSFCGVFRSSYKTVKDFVVDVTDIGIETVGIVVPGIDRESRERAKCCNICPECITCTYCQ